MPARRFVRREIERLFGTASARRPATCAGIVDMEENR